MVDNIKDNQRIVITHGELAFIPIDRLSKGKTVNTRNYIAGHSETGHHHILESGADFAVLEKDDEREVLLQEVGKLWHNKTFDVHETRTLAPGAYKIVYKTEYNPFTKVIQRIFD